MTENRATNIRIPPDVKAAATARARREYRTLTDVVVRFLREYGAGAPVGAPSVPVTVIGDDRMAAGAGVLVSGAGVQPVLVPAGRPESGRDNCPHPKARVLKGLCGACGEHVGSGR